MKTREGAVTVQSVDHETVSDVRYRLVFPDFETARTWIRKTIKRCETYNIRIRLTAIREWPDGVRGIELLGKYESATNC